MSAWVRGLSDGIFSSFEGWLCGKICVPCKCAKNR